MKVLLLFCLIVSTCFSFPSKDSFNLRSYADDSKCLVSLGYEIQKHLEIPIFYFERRDIKFLNGALGSIVDETETNNKYCPFETHPCKNDFEDYISNSWMLFSSMLDMDYPKIIKNLRSLYQVSLIIQDKCWSGNKSSSMEKTYKAQVRKNSFFLKF